MSRFPVAEGLPPSRSELRRTRAPFRQFDRGSTTSGTPWNQPMPKPPERRIRSATGRPPCEPCHSAIRAQPTSRVFSAGGHIVLDCHARVARGVPEARPDGSRVWSAAERPDWANRPPSAREGRQKRFASSMDCHECHSTATSFTTLRPIHPITMPEDPGGGPAGSATDSGAPSTFEPPTSAAH